MDKHYIEQHNVIERFVLNQLSESELDEFLLLQMMDPSIQKEIAETRALIKGIRSTESSTAKEPGFTISSTWLWSGMLLLTLISIYFLLPTEKNNLPEKAIVIDTTLNKTPIPKKNEELIDSSRIGQEETNQEEITPQKTENETKPAKKKTIPPPKAIKEDPLEKKKRLIATADYLPNPTLSKNLGLHNFRGNNNYQLSISQPDSIKWLKLNKESVEFKLEGFLKSEASEMIDEFEAYIFSNKEEDYKSFRPLFSHLLTFKKEEGGFSFQHIENLPLKPGRYYLEIQDYNRGMAVFTSQFFVE